VLSFSSEGPGLAVRYLLTTAREVEGLNAWWNAIVLPDTLDRQFRDPGLKSRRPRVIKT
jgi:hypothetical protein